jgi:hypothetical protein
MEQWSNNHLFGKAENLLIAPARPKSPQFTGHIGVNHDVQDPVIDITRQRLIPKQGKSR